MSDTLLKWRYVGYFPKDELREYVMYFDGNIQQVHDHIMTMWSTFTLKRLWLDDEPDPKPEGWIDIEDHAAFEKWLKTHTWDQLFEMQPHFRRDCWMVFYFEWREYLEKHNETLNFSRPTPGEAYPG